MRRAAWIPALILAAASGTAPAGQPAVALLGSFPEGRSLETAVVEKAVDDAAPGGPRLRLDILNTGPADAGMAQALAKLASEPDVLAVVVYGEAGASPAVLDALGRDGLAVVEATSWAQPRPAQGGATWLSPYGTALASTAALYARRGAHLKQVAVVDDGSDTSEAFGHAFADRFRALGGHIPYLGTWKGDAEGLSATVKTMAPYWPQMVFYTGDAAHAAALLLAMRTQHSLLNADLFGMPPIFGPDFFRITRLKGTRTRAVFPCPDYDGMGNLVRNLGFALPRTSPQYRAYLHYDFRHPGRWTSMLYDAASLAVRAVRDAALKAAGPGQAPGTTPTSQALPEPTRAEVVQALDAIPGYRGMRGDVTFNARREPSDSRAMVYFAINRVDRKTMTWLQRAYGPPF